MNLNLTTKRAVVCGSSQGMGKAIAEALAQLGADVTLLARNRAALASVRDGLANHGEQQHGVLTADFSQPDTVKTVMADYMASGAQIHILINNTGGPVPGLAHNAEPDAFLAAFNQHLICNQILAQAVIPTMKQAQYGRIINVISTSVKQPLNGLGVSNTIRGAVASWAKTLANEIGQYNITVNNVLPGATSTQRLSAIIDNKAKKSGKSIEETIALEKAAIPLRRFGTPEEFANVVAFLASPAAAYVSGINVPIDGGRTGCL